MKYTKDELLEMAIKTEKDLLLSYKFNAKMLGIRLIKLLAFSKENEDLDQINKRITDMVFLEVMRLNQVAKNMPAILEEIRDNDGENLDMDYFENTFIENQSQIKTYDMDKIEKKLNKVLKKAKKCFK